MNSQDKAMEIRAGAAIRKQTGKLESGNVHILEIEWFEAGTTLLRRKTDKGVLVIIKKNALDIYSQEDVIYQSEEMIVIVRIRPCETIVIYPSNLGEAGKICFEIGNQHIPIFIGENNEIMAAYDARLYDLLLSGNFNINLESRILEPARMIRAYGNHLQ